MIMHNIVDENTSMCERILTDIQQYFNGEHNLNEFTIVPINESRNKSPVLYEQHCLGLESWCVKHIYHYVYTELFQFKHLLKKQKLVHQKLEHINKFLISALLLQPDVITFWNMRRELVERGISNFDKELILTKLVLSHKSKSNECFAYRKWIINKLTKNIRNVDILQLLNNEFAVTAMAAEKSPNNYHAWSYRIWCVQNILTKTEFVETVNFMNMILSELDFSNVWVHKHVSEHAGFHYRQYLCNNILKNEKVSTVTDINYHCLIEPFIGIKFSNCDNLAYLNNLVGKHEVTNNNDSHTLLKCYNYVYYFIILLADLFYYIEQLNETFPGHEAIWYHRRFVVFSLLKGAYDYHNVTWKRTFTPNNLNDVPNDINIISTMNNVYGSGEKSPKLLKYDIDKIESSHLYKLLLESEIKFIKQNSSNMSCSIQKELALRHGKWMKFVLGLNKISV